MGKLLALSLLFLVSISTLLITISPVTAAPPFSTSGRWIIDGYGRRVKLACVNWVAHMDVMVAEGLSKKPINDITTDILGRGFNCVRLTWATYMATDKSLDKVTVRQSLQTHGLSDSISGLEKNNPSILDLPLLKAFQAVVINLAKNNVLIILDNHVSKPGWCCGADDGNGFFGDTYFDPFVWLSGLSRMATLFRGVQNVVGMSLRNELRGPKANVNDWYTYMEAGAELVHTQNPNLLVILSGLNNDLDLSFLKDRPVSLSFTGKLVFEVHWYGFSDGRAWVDGNQNDVCGRVSAQVMSRAGFLAEQGFPLFVSEFGIDQSGNNVNDNRYIDCFLGIAAEHDWDWAMWSYVGSYYLREGQVDVSEYFGVMNENWDATRNSAYMSRIDTVRLPFQGPEVGSGNPVKVIFHPQTGLCIGWDGPPSVPRLGGCEITAWEYTPEKNLKIKGTNYCMQAVDLGGPGKIDTSCNDKSAKWETVTDSGMHIATTLYDPNDTCLDLVSNEIVTGLCKCLGGSKKCDPSSQWFKIIDSSRIMKGQRNNLVLPNPRLLT